MATKPKPTQQPLTPAQIQRALEKKYGVIACPFWFDFYALQLTIDGEPAPTGTELVFRSADGTVCGAGVTFRDGMMRMSPCYADDPYDKRKTGAFYGEEIFIFDGSDGSPLHYAPIVKHPGGWMKVGLTNLRTSDVGGSALPEDIR